MTRQFQYQDDLNFQQAKRSLRQLLAGLELTTAEQLGLETDLRDLQAFLEKLEEDRIHIAAFGMVGRGKSSLLNALLGHTVFHTGPTHGVTRTWQQAAWVLEENVVINTPLGSQLVLIDTPGLDEIAGEARAEMAQRVAWQADLLLFVVSGDLTRIEYEALAQLREEGKPMLLVFNKIDQYPDMDRRLVYEKLCQERVKQLLTPAEVVMVAASPRVPQPVYLEDGTVMAQLVQAPPQIEPLRAKILEVLQREGRSLIGLNTLLFANRLQQEVIATKLEHRSHQAQEIIWGMARTKAVAVAINPLTLLDTLGALVLDVTLILRLSRLYDLPLTTHGATQLLQSIILSMLSLGAGEWIALLGVGSLKMVLGAATPLTAGFSIGAYTSVALTQAVLAGMSSYAIGSAATVYLANGASWGKDGPKTVIAQILDTLDEQSIMARIRSELHQRAHLSSHEIPRSGSPATP